MRIWSLNTCLPVYLQPSPFYLSSMTSNKCLPLILECQILLFLILIWNRCIIWWRVRIMKLLSHILSYSKLYVILSVCASQARLLTSTNWTWACPWHVCMVTRRMIKGWTSTKHEECGQRHAKGILQRLSAERAGELFNLSRNQQEIMVELPKEHSNLIGHPFKLGLVGSPRHYRCKQTLETASRVLYDCEALVVLRFRHLGHHFLEPAECTDISISTVQHFFQSTGLLKCPPWRILLYSILFVHL